MSVSVPVVRKYHVGDHVGLLPLMAVGEVVDRRGVFPLTADNGTGRYLVEVRGMPEELHEQYLISACRCTAHEKAIRQLMRLHKSSRRQGNEVEQVDVIGILQSARPACGGSYQASGGGVGLSRIWHESDNLVNCSGKERLPLNVNVVYGTRPPFFELKTPGTWNPSEAARYAR